MKVGMSDVVVECHNVVSARVERTDLRKGKAPKFCVLKVVFEKEDGTRVEMCGYTKEPMAIGGSVERI